MSLACPHTTAPTGHSASVTIAQFARSAVVSDPRGRRPGGPVGCTDPGIALEPDDVVEAQLLQDAEQLGVGKSAVSEEGDPDALRQHRRKPAQAGILVVIAS
jgi:hypothetical protein